MIVIISSKSFWDNEWVGLLNAPLLFLGLDFFVFLVTISGVGLGCIPMYEGCRYDELKNICAIDCNYSVPSKAISHLSTLF